MNRLFYSKIFRHGARNPSRELYPNDPYKDKKHWPEGFEQLTNVSLHEHEIFSVLNTNSINLKFYQSRKGNYNNTIWENTSVEDIINFLTPNTRPKKFTFNPPMLTEH